MSNKKTPQAEASKRYYEKNKPLYAERQRKRTQKGLTRDYQRKRLNNFKAQGLINFNQQWIKPEVKEKVIQNIAAHVSDYQPSDLLTDKEKREQGFRVFHGVWMPESTKLDIKKNIKQWIKEASGD